MSELSNWEKVSKMLAGGASVCLAAVATFVMKQLKQNELNELRKNELNDVQAHLNSMGIIDKHITHKADYKYYKNKRDELKSKRSK